MENICTNSGFSQLQYGQGQGWSNNSRSDFQGQGKWLNFYY